MKYTIKAVNEPGGSRTGGLRNVTVARINKVLGFTPNCEDDESKVKYSWGFTATDENGKVYECGIWDYKGSYLSNQFSTDGPKDLFVSLFGASKINSY